MHEKVERSHLTGSVTEFLTLQECAGSILFWDVDGWTDRLHNKSLEFYIYSNINNSL